MLRERRNQFTQMLDHESVVALVFITLGHIVAVHEIQSFGEAWTGPSVRGTTKRVGRHLARSKPFVTVLRHNHVQLALLYAQHRRTRTLVNIKNDRIKKLIRGCTGVNGPARDPRASR